MKDTACVWCSKLIKVCDTYDDLTHKGICSRGCKDAESLFNTAFSDEEYNRKAHYKQLTEGSNEQGGDQ